MSGPVTKPSDVPSPIPQTEPSPEEMQLLSSGLNKMQQHFSSEQATQENPEQAAQQAPAIPPEDQQLLDSAFAKIKSAETQQQAEQEGVLKPLAQYAATLPVSPLLAMYNIGKTLLAGSEGEVPMGKRALAKLGKSPEQQQQILQNMLGQGFETAVQDGEVMWRPQGGEFKPLDPKQTKKLRELVADVVDWFPEFGEGAVQTGATAAGMALAPATAGTSLVAGTAIGAAAGATVAGAREVALRLAGADPSEHYLRDVGLGGVFGGVGGLVGTQLRNSAQKGVNALKESVEESSGAGRAVKVGRIQQAFEDIYGAFTGRAYSTPGAGGEAAEKVVSRLESRLGQAIETAWNVSETAAQGKKIVPQNLLKAMNDELATYYRAVPVPPTRPGGRVMMELESIREVPADMKAFYTNVKNIWGQLTNDGGVTVPEYKQLLSRIKGLANYNTQAPGVAENTWRTLDKVFSRERDEILNQLTKGTDIDGFVTKSFENYRTNIEAVKELAKAADKAPEKFAAAIFRDTKSASLARDTLSLTDEGSQVWSNLRSTWFNEAVNKVKDKRTGIVDLTQLADTLGKNRDLTDELLGPGSMKELTSLGTALEKITWKGLLQNPDSVKSTGIIRALGKFVISKFNPAYGANVLGAMASYDPQVLSLIQQKGILAFANEAKTVVERNHWMQAANAIQRLMDATQRTVAGQKIPLERNLIGGLLNLGYRNYADTQEQVASRKADSQELIDNYLQTLSTKQAAQPQQ